MLCAQTVKCVTMHGGWTKTEIHAHGVCSLTYLTAWERQTRSLAHSLFGGVLVLLEDFVRCAFEPWGLGIEVIRPWRILFLKNFRSFFVCFVLLLLNSTCTFFFWVWFFLRSVRIVVLCLFSSDYFIRDTSVCNSIDTVS